MCNCTTPVCNCATQNVFCPQVEECNIVSTDCVEYKDPHIMCDSEVEVATNTSLTDIIKDIYSKFCLLGASNSKTIVSASINIDGELIIVYSDSTSQNLGVVVGTNGTNGVGVNGVSIVNVTVNGSNELIITLSDATVINAGVINVSPNILTFYDEKTLHTPFYTAFAYTNPFLGAGFLNNVTQIKSVTVTPINSVIELEYEDIEIFDVIDTSSDFRSYIEFKDTVTGDSFFLDLFGANYSMFNDAAYNEHICKINIKVDGSLYVNVNSTQTHGTYGNTFVDFQITQIDNLQINKKYYGGYTTTYNFTLNNNPIEINFYRAKPNIGVTNTIYMNKAKQISYN